MDMNEICDRMNDENLDFQTFLIGCLSHGKHFQDEDTSELLAVLERDWALAQQEILKKADKGKIFEMAVEELEQKKARIKRKIDLFEKTINDSGMLGHQSVWANGIKYLRSFDGVQGLEIDPIEFNPTEYKKRKCEELKKSLRGTKRTLEDVWSHSAEPRDFARLVYKLARTKF